MLKLLSALALVTLAPIAGCAGSRPDVVTIDRSFLHAFSEHPQDHDLAGHYRELQYLAHRGDPDAVYAVLLYFTSDHWRPGPGCPCHSTDDLALAAFDELGPEGLFWSTLPRLPAGRQARALILYSNLYKREDSFGMRLYSMADFEGDRDAYLEAHPETLAALRRSGVSPWAAADPSP